jgi:hypothetical protein
MTYLFLVLLCGLPWANFLLNKFDIWHAQGMFFQFGILLLFCWSFIEKPKYNFIQNKPLASLILWMGIITAVVWGQVLVDRQTYAIKIFLPFFNFLCFMFFYKLSVEYLDTENIERILKYLSYSVIVILFYCVLQKLNLDQFYTAVFDKGGLNLGHIGDDALVGTIGNSSHLAGYLALCQPLFFNKKGVFPLLLLWTIILLTGSLSGVLGGVAVLLFWLTMKKKWALLWSFCVISIISIILLWIKYPVFFSLSGRMGFWKILWGKFFIKPITGWGLGTVGAWQIKIQGSNWRHAHQEYLQMAVEIGLIGLGIIFWGIWEYFRVFWKARKNDLAIRLASIFTGFLVLSLLNFPAHLWLTGSMAIIGYAWIYTIHNEVLNGG